MANSENTKLSIFIKMCKNDKRMILSRNQDVFVQTGVCQSYNCGANGNQKKMSVFSKDNIEECEHVTVMIRELSSGVNGFSMTEIADILAYISTN